LLQLIGLPHVVQPAAIDESREPGEAVLDFVVRTARDKALAVATSESGLPVLGADTVVEIDGAVLGKPRIETEAVEMLTALAGRTHSVHTAMALVVDGSCHSLVDTAEVRMRALDRGTIDWYVATGEPMDKAGAYAIQGAGGVLVEAMAGSPHTVVGLTLHRLPELFARCGLSLVEMLHGGV
jgi:septum formation protein